MNAPVQYKRFLRDNQFEELVKEIQSYSDAIVQSQALALNLDTLSIMYKTSKVALERMEEVLDRTKAGEFKIEEIQFPLKEAISHIRTGLDTIRTSLEEIVIEIQQNMATEKEEDTESEDDEI